MPCLFWHLQTKYKQRPTPPYYTIFNTTNDLNGFKHQDGIKYKCYRKVIIHVMNKYLGDIITDTVLYFENCTMDNWLTFWKMSLDVMLLYKFNTVPSELFIAYVYNHWNMICIHAQKMVCRCHLCYKNKKHFYCTLWHHLSYKPSSSGICSGISVWFW